MMLRCAAFLAVVGFSQAATTLTLRPSASTANAGDAYLRAAAPTSNFGGAGALVVSGSGAGNTNGPFASVLKFDLALATSALDAAYGAGNWTIDSILLELTAVTPNNVTFNANAAGTISIDWLSTDSWSETGGSGITWNSLPSVVAGGSQSLGSLSYNGSLGTFQAAVTPSAGLLNDFASGGTASLYLHAGADPAASMVFNSRNFGTEASRPALTIVASPEPGRVSLFLLGAGILLARRRRHASMQPCR